MKDSFWKGLSWKTRGKATEDTARNSAAQPGTAVTSKSKFQSLRMGHHQGIKG